jgi:hypothetical protein
VIRRHRAWLGGALMGALLVGGTAGAGPARAGGPGPPICSACDYKTTNYTVKALVHTGTEMLDIPGRHPGAQSPLPAVTAHPDLLWLPTD